MPCNPWDRNIEECRWLEWAEQEIFPWWIFLKMVLILRWDDFRYINLCKAFKKVEFICHIEGDILKGSTFMDSMHFNMFIMPEKSPRHFLNHTKGRNHLYSVICLRAMVLRSLIFRTFSLCENIWMYRIRTSALQWGLLFICFGVDYNNFCSYRSLGLVDSFIYIWKLL